MQQSNPDREAKLREWEMMRAFRSLDTRVQEQVLQFVLDLEAGKVFRRME